MPSNMPNIGKKPEIDLFASRLSNQLPSYYSWNPDPKSPSTGALQQKWYHKSRYAFPPFPLIHKVLEKVEEEKVPSLIIATPTWQIPKLEPRTRTSFSEKSYHFAIKERPIKGSSNPTVSLIQNGTMQLTVWVVSGSVWQGKEYQ